MDGFHRESFLTLLQQYYVPMLEVTSYDMMKYVNHRQLQAICIHISPNVHHSWKRLKLKNHHLDLKIFRVTRTLDMQCCEDIDLTVSDGSLLSCLNITQCEGIEETWLLDLIPKVSNLTVVDFTGSSITHRSINCLASFCAKLTSISVTIDDISEECIDALSLGCPGLQVVRFICCYGLSDTCVQMLSQRCGGLSSVDLSECGRITDAAVFSLASGCPGLTYLNLCDCHQVSDAGIIEISKRCPDLLHLDISNGYHNTKFTDLSLSSLGERCRKLKSINIGYCVEISDHGFSELANCTQIDTLEMGGCTDISESAICQFLELHPLLKRIDLWECAHVTDKTLEALATHCPMVVHVGIVSCNDVTDVGISSLAAGCRQLNFLDPDGCPNITLQCLERLVEMCPGLERCKKSFGTGSDRSVLNTSESP
jgi:Leucine Rich repeat